eukprot:2350524-Karenia_brevis.AAC.1
MLKASSAFAEVRSDVACVKGEVNSLSQSVATAGSDQKAAFSRLEQLIMQGQSAQQPRRHAPNVDGDAPDVPAMAAGKEKTLM